MATQDEAYEDLEDGTREEISKDIILKSKSFRFIDLNGTSIEGVSSKEGIAIEGIDSTLLSNLKDAGMFRDDYYTDAVLITTLQAGESDDQARSFIMIQYAGKVTGSISTTVISGSTDTEVYETLDDTDKNIFIDLMITGSAGSLKPRRQSYTNTAVTGGEIHKVIIKNKNPIQAPLVLVASQSAS